jgi:hypothetical protein
LYAYAGVGQRCSLIVILNKRSLRGEEPVPSEVEGIWASRVMCRVLCDSITARLARSPIEPHRNPVSDGLVDFPAKRDNIRLRLGGCECHRSIANTDIKTATEIEVGMKTGQSNPATNRSRKKLSDRALCKCRERTPFPVAHNAARC